MVRLGDINPKVWDDVTAVMEKKLKKYDFSSDDLVFDFRVMAGSRRMDRQLNEKFGMFKGIILHPATQYIKELLENHFTTDILLGDPLLPVATAVIMLYMMYKRIPLDALILIGCFILNVNPLYVVTGMILWKLSIVKPKPKMYTKPIVNKGAKPRLLEQIPPETTYDFILLGGNISTMYTAALLSKAGQKCCVVLPPEGSPLQVRPEGAPTAMAVENQSIGKVDKYQTLLDAAQSLAAGERVTFAPIGSAADGFAHCIINKTPRKADPNK